MKNLIYYLVLFILIGCGNEPKPTDDNEITTKHKINNVGIIKDDIKSLKKNMSTENIKILYDDKNEIILLNTSKYTYFGTGKYIVKNKAKMKQLIAKFENYQNAFIYIVGHTDSAGTDKSNQLLSEMRAREVYKFFIDSGHTKYNLDYIGYGEEQPVATNATTIGRAKNRRVELVISDKLVTSKHFIDTRIININYLNNHNNINPKYVEISIKGLTKNKSEQELKILHAEINTPKRKSFDTSIKKRKHFINFK